MRALRVSELIPPGFNVGDVKIGADRVIVAIRAAGGSCPCPRCGAMALRVHSRYRRKVADLPLAGRRTEMVLEARRFFL
jgi:transposase